MAERRMFAKSIIDSDAFLDMPLTTQAFYFHLSMRADDDGFINNPRRILRLTGCNDDDMKLLFAKGFVIPFKTGVCVVSHWRVHNYIQKDRYKETVYIDEKKSLEIKENGVYSILDTECIHDVSSLDAQVRLGKDRLEEGKERKEDITAANATPAPYSEIVSLYNSICRSFPKITRLSEARKKAIKARLKNYNLEDFQQLFEIAESSQFLKGKNSKNWTATFDWLITDSGMAKVLDGNYTDKSKISAATDGTPHPDGGIWLNGKQLLGV